MNVKSAKNQEFVQITRSFEFTPDSSSLAFLSGEARATKEFVRKIRRILQNKPNFSPFFNQKQRFHRKTNPIQSQFKPNSKSILAQKQGSIMRTNPIQSQSILGMNVKKPVRNPLSLRIFELTKRDKKYRIKFFKNDIWGAEAADK